MSITRPTIPLRPIIPVTPPRVAGTPFDQAVIEVQCWTRRIDETRVLQGTKSGSVYVTQVMPQGTWIMRQLTGDSLERLTGHSWHPSFQVVKAATSIATRRMTFTVEDFDGESYTITTSVVTDVAAV